MDVIKAEGETNRQKQRTGIDAKDTSKKRRSCCMALEGYGLEETAAQLAADGADRT